MAPAPARGLHVCLKGVPPEQNARRIRKVLLEGEVVLQVGMAELQSLSAQTYTLRNALDCYGTVLL